MGSEIEISGVVMGEMYYEKHMALSDMNWMELQNEY